MITITDEVLALLRKQPMTRAQIIAATGFSEACVRDAMERLLDWGRICSAGREQAPYPRRGGGALLWTTK